MGKEGVLVLLLVLWKMLSCGFIGRWKMIPTISTRHGEMMWMISEYLVNQLMRSGLAIEMGGMVLT